MGLCAAILLNVGSLAAVRQIDSCSPILGAGERMGVVDACQAPQARQQMFSAAEPHR